MPSLEAVVEAFCAELRRGVTPDIETFAMRCPEAADTLRRLLPTLLTMDDFAREATGLPQDVEVSLPMMLGNEFRLERILGRGGMGTVFEAVQIPLERRCAVKVLARNFAANPRHRAAFIHEARVIGNLHHPHILKVFSAGETDEYAYYAMEYVGGQSLDRMPPEGPKQLAALALQAALALAYAHRCGVIHCDIKPSNLLLGSDTRLLIGDFGLARLTNSNTHTTEAQCSGGTRAYMAPECQANGSFTPASDQYAFGVTFLELAAHGSPLPPDLTAILTVCSAPTPEQRYRDMDDVVADLRRFCAGEPVSVRPASFRRKALLWAHRHPFTAASVAVLAIGLPLFTALLANSHRQTLRALEAAERNLAVADTALACTFEHVGRNDPSRKAAALLDVLMPYYRDIILRRDATAERLAAAEAIIADIALRTGDYTAAVEANQRRYAADPSPAIANQLAEALALQGETEAAQTLYRATAAYLTDDNPAHRIEAIRAYCALGQSDAETPLGAAREALEPLLAADPENADLRYLKLRLEACTETAAQTPRLDAEALQLAQTFPETPAYGIAALTRLTNRLARPEPLTKEDETHLESARKIARQLLGRWPDDPQILLAAVHFSVADSNHLHQHPRLNQQALRSAEQLSGALEVLFFGSSLPEDVRDPLFNSLLTRLLESRQQAKRNQAMRLRRNIRENLPHRNRPFKRYKSPGAERTPRHQP